MNLKNKNQINLVKKVNLNKVSKLIPITYSQTIKNNRQINNQQKKINM